VTTSPNIDLDAKVADMTSHLSRGPLRRVPEQGEPVQHRGQVRMAERFIEDHSEALRYVHGLGWHLWESGRWMLDEERHDLAAAVETVKNTLRALSYLEGQERDDLYKDVRKSESASGLEGMLKIASSKKPISVASKALDAHPYLFNTPEGTVDLLEGSIREASREDLITKVANGSVTEARNEEFEQFLIRILPDEEVRRFVQRLIGYAMLGKVTEHVMPIFTGMGANGKGTLRDAVLNAFGDYAIEVSPALLMESKHERHGAFLMRLRGARLAFCSETDKDRKFAEATMKRLVGGDPIEANLMHRNPITFDPSHTLIMLTNHLPKVSGDDPAVWRRILVVPFDVVIPEEERDGGLPDRFKDASDAIVSWAYQGWLDYQEQGLNPPEAVRVKTAEYRASNDVMQRFFDDGVHQTPHGFVKARELFTAWSKWCHDNGYPAEVVGTEVSFADSMKKRGFEKKRTNAGQVYRGLMLLSNRDEDD
jgi:putative DNA primase/helicase